MKVWSWKFGDARVNDQEMAVTGLLNNRQLGPGMKMESREMSIAGSRTMSLSSFVDRRLASLLVEAARISR